MLICLMRILVFPPPLQICSDNLISSRCRNFRGCHPCFLGNNDIHRRQYIKILTPPFHQAGLAVWERLALLVMILILRIAAWSRVAEVAREHGWHPPKSLDSDEKFKPEHTLFCRELRFVAIYALFFWRSLGIKSALLGKNSASWARSALLHGIYCIFYWVKFEN